MSSDTLEIINKAHKFLIAGSIFFAFFHFVYLFWKSYKKAAIAEDFSSIEIKRVRQEYSKNWKQYLKIIWHPFKVFLIYLLCISVYSIVVIKLGLIW